MDTISILRRGLNLAENPNTTCAEIQEYRADVSKTNLPQQQQDCIRKIIDFLNLKETFHESSNIFSSKACETYPSRHEIDANRIVILTNTLRNLRYDSFFENVRADLQREVELVNRIVADINALNQIYIAPIKSAYTTIAATAINKGMASFFQQNRRSFAEVTDLLNFPNLPSTLKARVVNQKVCCACSSKETLYTEPKKHTYRTTRQQEICNRYNPDKVHEYYALVDIWADTDHPITKTLRYTHLNLFQIVYGLENHLA